MKNEEPPEIPDLSGQPSNIESDPIYREVMGMRDEDLKRELKSGGFDKDEMLKRIMAKIDAKKTSGPDLA